MNNQICNPKTEVPTGFEFNDKDYLNTLTSTLKEMTKGYATALTEASNETLYSRYKSVFDEISCLQREAFELMFKNGWYILEKADTNKINTKHQTLDQEHQDLHA